MQAAWPLTSFGTRSQVFRKKWSRKFKRRQRPPAACCMLVGRWPPPPVSAASCPIPFCPRPRPRHTSPKACLPESLRLRPTPAPHLLTYSGSRSYRRTPQQQHRASHDLTRALPRPDFYPFPPSTPCGYPSPTDPSIWIPGSTGQRDCFGISLSSSVISTGPDADQDTAAFFGGSTRCRTPSGRILVCHSKKRPIAWD